MRKVIFLLLAGIAGLTLGNIFLPAPNAQTESDRAAQILNSTVFNEFDSWTKEYLAGKTDSAHLAAGETLAAKRFALFQELIRIAPEEAVQRAFPAQLAERLPKRIAERIERPLSAYADFNVLVIDRVDHRTGRLAGSQIEREVVVGDTRYQAFVYGRKNEMTSKFNLPVRGIAAGDLLAVHEDPVRRIEPAEYAKLGVDRSRLAGPDAAVAEIGGRLVYFSDRQELETYAGELDRWEKTIGPRGLSPEEKASPGGENESAAVSSWTEGAKSVLLIRVDFSDRTGEPTDYAGQPLTQSRAENLINNTVNSFYEENSYNKTSLQTTVTPVVRMPQTLSHYTQTGGVNQMAADARAAARAAGFETNDFNLDLVAFSYTRGFGWAGIAALGAKGALLNGFFDLQVTGHELGHNYGLLHANLWRTSDGSVIGSGQNVEYGDCYDLMGACTNQPGEAHFNARYKRLLGWLTDQDVRTVTADGTYRIYAFDSPGAGGVRALQIEKDSTKRYWVEFRQLFTFNSNAMNGAILHWDYQRSGTWETQLLDMIASPSGDVSDAPLQVGENFYDETEQIRITVLNKGNTTPESLDIRVEFGSAPPPPPQNPQPPKFDFDGDNRDDISIFRPGPGEWWYLQSSNGQGRAFQFGQSSDRITPADFTGDGRTDIAFWRESSGEWFILRSEDSSFYSFPHGQSGDIPMPADYDGDGVADPAVYRPTDNNWYILNSLGGTTIQEFGLPGDVPVPADYDGDGRADLAIYRPGAAAEWYILKSSDFGILGFAFGGAGDVAVPADYTGDGRTDLAFRRPATGEWFVLRSDDSSFYSFPFGLAGDRAVPADYDGDGRADPAVYRPTDHNWYLQRSTAGFTAVRFGDTSDQPVPAAYGP